MPTIELPQYAEIKRKLIAEIRSGQWTVGGAFPSEAQLLTRYKVSRSTLVRSVSRPFHWPSRQKTPLGREDTCKFYQAQS